MLLVCGSAARAVEESSLDDLLKNFGWDFATAQIETQKVGDGLFVLFGIGGNIAVSVGADGVLIVDDQFPQLMPKIEAAIAALGGKKIDFAVNTHWHFDHADGNQVLGPNGTWLVSQANSRDMMRGEHVVNGVVFKYRQKPYPAAALPAVTFTDAMQFHFNGQQIDLEHYGAAHTTGDSAVYFRKHNAVHLGDVFNNSGYPFIDVDNGGDLSGVIAFCKAVIAQLQPGAVVIPGHGRLATYDDLVGYVAMLETVRSTINRMLDSGASLADVVAAKPTAAWDAVQGDSTGFVDRAYTSLAKERAVQR
jgi:glyoxylase-like metal-dependent hydrolase (beta-lactamase superfamily II)